MRMPPSRDADRRRAHVLRIVDIAIVAACLAVAGGLLSLW
jgi:hypothetical protein